MKIYFVLNKYTDKLLGSVIARNDAMANELAKTRFGSYATTKEA